MTYEYAIGTYVEFVDRVGDFTGYAFQNFAIGEIRFFLERPYQAAGFGFSGASYSLEGENISAQLEFAVTDLVLSFAQIACDNFWLTNVRTVWLDLETLAETGVYSEEIYSVQSFTNDHQRLVFDLSSPIDAFTAQIPRRVLSRCLVGALPSTGSLVLS